MSNTSIMSIKEMIDLAFGDPEENVINLKLIQTVMYILARQLRLLERKVSVEISSSIIRSTSSISITEVKILANIPKKKKKTTKHIDDTRKYKGGGRVPLEAGKSDPSSKSTTERSSEKSTSKSTTEKTSTSEPTTSSNKTKSSTDKSSSDKSNKEYKRKDYHHLLEAIEQQRERELRIVNQRADSREEAKNAPTPMASLDSMEMQYEKLLIVERVPTEEGRSPGSRGLHLSVVTKEQFDNLAQMVKELQNKFGSIATPKFPDNIQLMEDLRRGASLTDAMAALQLSARLDAVEKTLHQMMSLITDLAIKADVNITLAPEEETAPTETRVIFEVSGQSDISSRVSKKPTTRKQSPKSERKLTELTSTDTIKLPLSTETSSTMNDEYLEKSDLAKSKKDWINANELDDAMQQVYDSLIKTVTNITNKTASNADSALKLAHKLEEKLTNTEGLESRMKNLEILVSEYAEQINILDTGLSSQMTNYQEQLTQMQHDLEAGLEAMAEALANTGGDTVAATELNLNFTNLQMDFDTANMKQKELIDNQEILSADLQSLWKQIELLRGTKSDREEVTDALRDKAGLGALNGLVTQEQFDAVRGDLEKRIGASYDKFNNQEIIWQKAIDDLLRELNEKADLVQVTSLRDDINSNLEKLRKRIKAMMEIIGEPRSAAVSKKLFRDTACLSCSSPAHMNIEEPNLIPPLPTLPNSHSPSVFVENTKKVKGDGDSNLCIPGKPIPHPKDPSLPYCQRYCGGSHTIISSTVKKSPVEIIIKQAIRHTITEVGSDGKVYLVEEQHQLKPCHRCNYPEKLKTKPSENEQADSCHEYESDITDVTSLDFVPRKECVTKTVGDVSVTPPLPSNDD